VRKAAMLAWHRGGVSEIGIGMDAHAQEKTRMTPEQYLAFEDTSKIKHEYFDGEIFAMTGAGLNHNRINRNITRKLENQLEGSSCEALASDMRVKVEDIEKYTYPDIAVVCGEIELEKVRGFDTLLNPVVIIEVLSNSTEAYDRGKKFFHYRLIPSLKEYILVSQYFCLVEKYSRGNDGSWKYFSYENMERNMTVESIKCELLLADIYYRVEFEGFDHQFGHS
jgi:Uma2 family endonuclease